MPNLLSSSWSRASMLFVVVLPACSALDELGTQANPERLAAGEPEKVRISSTATGFVVEEPFLVRIDRLAYEGESTRYSIDRARCLVVEVASEFGSLTNPYDGAPSTRLELSLDRGASVELVAASADPSDIELRARIFDVQDCTTVDPTTRVLASAHRILMPAP